MFSIFEKKLIIANNHTIYISFIICVLLILIITKKWRMYWLTLQLPGPFPWPIIGTTLLFTNNLLISTRHLFNKYGTRYRFWLGWHFFYVTRDPEEIKIIFNKQHKKSIMYKTFHTLIGDGMFISNNPIWKKNRKYISPAFNQKLLDGNVEIFVQNADLLVERLCKSRNKVVDIKEYIKPITMKITCEALLEFHDPSIDYLKICNSIDRILEICIFRSYSLFYLNEIMFNFKQLIVEQKKLIQEVHQFARMMICQKKKNYLVEKYDSHSNENGKSKSFADIMVNLNDIGVLNEKGVQDEICSMLGAGSFTSSTLMAFCCILIGMDQDVQEKAYKEIIDVLGTSKTIESDDLSKLKYLEQILNETLRLFPVGNYMSRELTTDVNLGNITLPKGTIVLIDSSSTHRNPVLWENPLDFDPDRFKPENLMKIHPSANLSFGSGPRNCIGKKFAMMEMKVIMASIIRNFKLKSFIKSVSEIKLFISIVLHMEGGQMCTIEKRI